MSGSVSWLEWTQQLQAYIAWVNSQLRKRPDLRPVQDLRTDLQSGEVLAQLIEIISGEKIAGIQYTPESIQVGCNKIPTYRVMENVYKLSNSNFIIYIVIYIYRVCVKIWKEYCNLWQQRESGCMPSRQEKFWKVT